MRLALIAWRARLRSAHNTLRYHSVAKIGLAVTIMATCAATIWSTSQMAERIQQWQTAGDQALTAGLWQLCLGIWGGSAFFALLTIMQTLWRNDEMILLFTLPMSYATLFRMIWGFLFLELWNWLLLQAIALGSVLLATLDWQGLSWLLMIQLGIGMILCCMLLGVLLFVRYIFVGNWKQRTLAVSLSTLLLVLAGRAVFFLMTKPGTIRWLQPEPIAGIFLLALGITMGPCATACGRLYATTFHLLQGLDRPPGTWRLPGVTTIQRLLERRRTLSGALAVRAVTNQSRNWFFWLRFTVTAILLALAPVVRTPSMRMGIPPLLFVVSYGTLLPLVLILETAPNSISAEGQRLNLYLVAPLPLSRLLRAKLTLFLFPVLIIGVLVGLVLSHLVALPLAQQGQALLAIVLIVGSLTTLLVLGSTWDLNLQTLAEGMEQIILQEETPLSPRRLTLVNLCVLFWAGMLLLLWRLPPLPALILLLLFTCMLIVGTWSFSIGFIHHLIKNG